MPSLLILLFVIAFAITPHVAIAQFVPTEIVYENSQEDVSVTHARLEEFGDERPAHSGVPLLQAGERVGASSAERQEGAGAV